MELVEYRIQYTFNLNTLLYGIRVVRNTSALPLHSFRQALEIVNTPFLAIIWRNLGIAFFMHSILKWFKTPNTIAIHFASSNYT